MYADIMDIVAPDEALAGSRVDIQVRIKNVYNATIGIMVAGALEYGVTPWPGIEFPEYSANVPPGETHAFAGNFTMPERAVTVHAYSYWYGSDGYWHFDDEMTKVVKLAELVPTFGELKIKDYVPI
jgi:hypothetical protein